MRYKEAKSLESLVLPGYSRYSLKAASFLHPAYLEPNQLLPRGSVKKKRQGGVAPILKDFWCIYIKKKKYTQCALSLKQSKKTLLIPATLSNSFISFSSSPLDLRLLWCHLPRLLKLLTSASVTLSCLTWKQHCAQFGCSLTSTLCRISR